MIVTNRTLLISLIILLIGISSQSYAGSVVTFLPCGDIFGNVLRDHSGNGYNAYVNGIPNIAKGRIGKAIEFNGIDTFAVLPHKDSYDFSKDESFSISLWITYNPRGVQQVIIEKPGTTSPFRIEILTDNKISFSLSDGTNSPKVILGDVSKNWHHCCFIRDVKGHKLYAYLDGKLVTQADDTTTAEISNKSDIYIGSSSGNTEMFKGFLDDIAIYNRALTKTEVKQAAQGNPPEIYHESALRRFEIISTISVPFTAIYSYVTVRGIEMAIQGKVAPSITQSDWLLAGGLTVAFSGLVGFWDWMNTKDDDISEMSNTEEKDQYQDRRYSRQYSMLSNPSRNNIVLALLSMRF